jgi:hypothetical protein
VARPSRAAVVCTLAAGATWFTLARTGLLPFDALTGWEPSLPPPAAMPPEGVPSGFRFAAYDVYAHFVPVMEYAGQALRAGGRGLWWTPLQSCGQPFAAFHGLLYPLHWLPVLFGIDAGLRLLIGANLLLGGVFAYLLGRELGARPGAALTGALTFQLGNAAAHVAAWTPLVLEPFVWFPAVLLCVERLLRAPDVRWVAALGAASCMAMLPAWPQLVLFLHQLVALRLLWAIAVARPKRLVASLCAVVAGMALGPLLDAVQLLPALEVARDSVRRVTLSGAEIVAAAPFSFSDFRTQLAFGRAYGQPFTVIPCVLASLALLRSHDRAIAAFYLVAGALFFTLAFGPETPLFDLYQALPAGRMFREPARFAWVTGFCLAVLAAIGAEVVASFAERPRPRGAYAAPVLAATALIALAAAAQWRLRPLEVVAGMAGIAIIAAALASARMAARAPQLVAWLYAVTLVVAPATGLHYLYPSSASLFENADLFARLGARTGRMARTYLVADTPLESHFALMAKSASLFGVPTLGDYEPQTARRYAEFLVRLRQGTPMRTLNAFYYPIEGWMSRKLNRSLLDLAAGRFIVVPKAADRAEAALSPPPLLRDENASLRVYENQSALPRALWVPRVEVVREPRVLLERLAARYFDPWQVALVEAPPPSGFRGEPAAAAGASAPLVTFVHDEPEWIVIDVAAPARGFLVLADQYHDGWQATVDGAPVAILRANYAFRAVEVPRGAARVEFRYAPRSWTDGALVSSVSLLAVGAVLVAATRRRRDGTPGSGGSTR